MSELNKVKQQFVLHGARWERAGVINRTVAQCNALLHVSAERLR